MLTDLSLVSLKKHIEYLDNISTFCCDVGYTLA